MDSDKDNETFKRANKFLRMVRKLTIRNFDIDPEMLTQQQVEVLVKLRGCITKSLDEAMSYKGELDQRNRVIDESGLPVKQLTPDDCQPLMALLNTNDTLRKILAAVEGLLDAANTSS